MTPIMEIALVLEDIRSLHNVGAAFRSADVFGVSRIYLCGYTGAPPRKEISKVALGAEEWVPWESRKSAPRLIAALRRQGYRIIALEATSGAVPLPKVALSGKVALVFGNEVLGVSGPSLRAADAVAAIPMLGRKESLNVSVAVGIALYELSRRGL